MRQSYRTRARLVEFSALGLLVLYLCYLTGFAFARSAGRKELLLSTVTDEGEEYSKLLRQMDEGSRVELEEFHRIETRNGAPSWEIKAKRARYFAAEAVSFIEDARLRVYRQDGPPVILSASSGKLFFSAGRPVRAELTGGIRVTAQNTLTFLTELAIYDVEQRTLMSPKPVVVKGKGIEIKANTMTYYFSPETIDFVGEVDTRFKDASEMPRPLAGMMNSGRRADSTGGE